MINANEYLKQNYPQNSVCQIDDSRGRINAISNQGKSRKGIVQLNISQQNLTGTLDLSTFINLEELWCFRNQLTDLILPDNGKLKVLNCGSNQLTQLILPINNQLVDINVSNNLLTSFNYHILNPATLTDLRLFNNNLPETELTVFSHLVNLTNLQIGNENKWIQTDKGNQFYGSLEPLKNCIKLKKRLNISNTNVNSGLEYLADSLENFYCYSSEGSHSKVKEIEKQLNSYSVISLNDHDNKAPHLKKWKEDYYQKNPNVKAPLIKSIVEERINNDKKLLPLIRNPEKSINPLNKDETSLLKAENAELKSEIFQLKYKLAEAEDYIEKLEKQLLERRINAWSTNHPQTISMTEEFTESIEISNSSPHTIIYRNPQQR